ncbi:MAG: hypothetical protein AAF629_04645 [Chloroflexota bacterium]
MNSNNNVIDQHPWASNKIVEIAIRLFERLRPRLFGLSTWLFIVLFGLTGIITLPNYGLTWDEALGNMFFGQRYLYYFATFNPDFLDFELETLAIHDRSFNLYESPFRSKPHEFPAFADTLSALFMETLSYGLGWLDPVDAFHLSPILLAMVLLVALFRWSRHHIGEYAAFLGIFMLGTYPRFWGDMHFNVKDIPETIFFAFTIMAFWVWYRNPSWLRAIVVGGLFGLAVAIKANALFIPVILIVGIWPWQLTTRPWQNVISHLRQYWSHYILMGFISPLLYFASWPYLYADPSRVMRHISYIRSQGGREGVSGWNWEPTIQAVSTMPEMVLLLLLVGLGFAVYHWRDSQGAFPKLLVIWLFVPIIRTSLPGTVNFDGIRYFEEFVPAACMLAGYGGVCLATAIGRRLHFTPFIIFELILLNIAIITFQFHPYQHIYFNSLVGGLSGAHHEYQFPEATDYWGSSYREGIRWLNENVPENTQVYVSVAPHIVHLVDPIWLRDDLTIIEEAYLIEKNPVHVPIYVMTVTRKSLYDNLAAYCAARLEPVHEIVVDDVPILQIYRVEKMPVF